jgi:hypothetical protein
MESDRVKYFAHGDHTGRGAQKKMKIYEIPVDKGEDYSKF